MAAVPQYLEVARSWQQSIRDRDRGVAQAMLRAWLPVERSLTAELEKVLAEIDAMRAAGVEPGVSWFVRSERLKVLREQIHKQIGEFAQVAADHTVQAQAGAVKDALKAGEDLYRAAAGVPGALGASSVWHRLPVEAFSNLIGMMADGSPVRAYLQKLAPDTWEEVSGVLSRAMAQGWNPRKTAARANQALQLPKHRAEAIARTAQMNASREASRANYAANSHVVTCWVWYSSLDMRTCPVCWAMHGQVFNVNTGMGSHVNCRCTMVPMVKSNAVQLPVGGEDLLRKRSVEEQKQVLGAVRWDAWKYGGGGKVERLRQFVTETEHPVWGGGLRLKTIGELEAEGLVVLPNRGGSGTPAVPAAPAVTAPSRRISSRRMRAAAPPAATAPTAAVPPAPTVRRRRPTPPAAPPVQGVPPAVSGVPADFDVYELQPTVFNRVFDEGVRMSGLSREDFRALPPGSRRQYLDGAAQRLGFAPGSAVAPDVAAAQAAPPPTTIAAPAARAARSAAAPAASAPTVRSGSKSWRPLSKYSYVDGDDEARAFFKRWYGDISPEEFLERMGVPPEAEVYFFKQNNALRMNAVAEYKNGAEEFRMERTFQPNRLEVHHDYFRLPASQTKNGAGARIFKSQVDLYTELGIKEITTMAARGRSFNGYYTWARFGYDAPIRIKELDMGEQLLDAWSALTGAAKDAPLRVSDLMKTKEGRQLWKDYGDTTNMKFSLKKGSLSQRVLDAYIKERFGEA